MKKQYFMVVVVLGALLVVFAGISQAGGWMHRSSGDERPVAEALGTESPAIADWAAAWEYFDVVETGAVPETASGGGIADELGGTEFPFPVGFVLAEPIETGTLPATVHEESWLKDYGND